MPHDHDEHEHTHDHDEHEHHHHHDHDGHEHDHDHDEHEHELIDGGVDELETVEPGVVAVTVTLHEDAIIVSGALVVYSEHPFDTRHLIADKLEEIADEVGEAGGVVGHVKASFVATSVDMLSVTAPKEAVQIKRSPELEIKIGVAAIVFSVEPAFAEGLVRDALTDILESTTEA
ncbi:MAG: hypothetical protein LBN30_08690 [Oscillospiraceae bacterium]|jgi:hypothetical protein|nr:hypothetical protein [Oscillospiraceae bacterium]